MGSSNDSDTYDAAYNDRLATIAEKEQAISQEYFDFWKSDYRGMEQAQIAANMRMIPSETDLNIAQNEAEMSLLPGQTELTQATNAANLSLLPLQTDFTKLQISDATQAINDKAPVRSKFFNESLTGVNVNDRVDKAGADVMQAYQNSDDIMRRDAARTGINPNSNRFTSNMNTNSLNLAKNTALAKTTARDNAEKENYTGS